MAQGRTPLLRSAPAPAGGRQRPPQAGPPGSGAQPGDVRRLGGGAVDPGALRRVAGRDGPGLPLVHPGHLPTALVHGGLRQLRRSSRRRPRTRSSRHAAQGAPGGHGPQALRATPGCPVGTGGLRPAAPGRPRPRRGGRVDPRGWRGGRRSGVGRRKRHHRRECPCDPRERRRPQRRYRRNAGPVGLADRGGHHRARSTPSSTG